MLSNWIRRSIMRIQARISVVDSRSREDNGDRFIRHLEAIALFLTSTTNTIEVFKFRSLECAANVEGSHYTVLKLLCLQTA